MKGNAALRSFVCVPFAALLMGASAAYAAPANNAGPHLTGKMSRDSGMIGGRQRSFILYVPQNLKHGAPLLIVLHGATQEGRDVRIATGAEFDELADREGFVVVYPDGIDAGWNACRRGPNRSTRNLSIDDVGFIDAIVAHQVAVNFVDPKRVFAVGHSNGGAMAYRLAFERPEEFAGIAAISSSLPVDIGCTPKNVPIPVMIINGTADPVNPYRGGISPRRMSGSDPVAQSAGGSMGSGGGGMGDTVAVRGSQIVAFAPGRGPVMSTEATAQYWAKLNGQAGSAERMTLPHKDPADPTSVEVMSWTAPGKPPVVLYSIVGGGHVVPQRYFRYPGIVGRQTEDMDAVEVVWDFFSKLPSRQ
jgi:polyhydroxybutyrate depolymerase